MRTECTRHRIPRLLLPLPFLLSLPLPRSRTLLCFIFLLLSFFLALDDGGDGRHRSGGVYAQSFAIPANWRKPTSSVSRHDRTGLVNGVLDTVLPTFNSSSGLLDGLTFTQTASLLVALSNSDAISGTTKNKDAVLGSLERVFVGNPGISSVVNSDPAIWGLAAISAHRAYFSPTALHHAQAMWDLLEGFMISEEDAERGSHVRKEGRFEGRCNGASTAGGVFYLASSPQNTDVNGETVGAFMALSAHLHALTSNQTYLSAATLSASFILNQLFNGQVVLDTITLANCFTTPDVVSYNSGFVIEGLSLLASVKGGEVEGGGGGGGGEGEGVSYEDFLQSLISTSIPNQRWTNVTDGVMIEGPGNATLAETNDFGQALKGIYIRGLYEAYNRTQPGSVVADFISSFITVQFNALQDRACLPGGHSYSSRWEGPPPTQMLPWGQLAALDVLNSAVGIAPPDTGSQVVPTTSSAQSVATPGTHSALATSPSATWTTQADSDMSHHSTSSTKKAIIAGTLVGAFVFLILSILLALYMIRRKRKRLEHIRNVLEETAVPYDPIASRSSSGSRDRDMVEVGPSSTERLIARPAVDDSWSTSAPPVTARWRTGQISVGGKIGTLNTRRTGVILPPGRYAEQERRTNESPTDPQRPSPQSEDPPSFTSSPVGGSGKEAGPTTASVEQPSNVQPPRTLDREEGGSSSSPPPPPPVQRGDPSTADLPELLSRLNQIMSHLPPGGVEEEEPPEYEG